MPTSRDLVIFMVHDDNDNDYDNDMTNYFIHCTCARGNEIEG